MKLRPFILLASAACMTALLPGCGKKTDAPSGGAAKRTLNIFCWSEYIPQAVVDGFAKEFNVQVNIENYASNEEMMAKLEGGSKYDLIQPSEYIIEEMVKAGKLEPLNLAAIPNIKNIEPKFRNMPHDPEGKYSVCWMAGTVGIVVNTEKIKDPIKGYADFFQDKHKGRLVVLDDNRELVAWALTTLGKEMNDLSEPNLAAAKDVLSKWLPLVQVYDSDSPKTALINGDVDLGIVWSGEAALLWKENKKFQYVLPAEGAHQFVDNLAVPKGAKNKEAAEQFINYVLRPEVSVKISEDFPYTNPNVEARKLMTKEQLENPASFPPGSPKLDIFKAVPKATSAAIDKLVTDLKNK